MSHRCSKHSSTHLAGLKSFALWNILSSFLLPETRKAPTACSQPLLSSSAGLHSSCQNLQQIHPALHLIITPNYLTNCPITDETGKI